MVNRFFFAILILAGIIVFVWVALRMHSETRQSILIISDPMVLVSWETHQRKGTVLVIPRNVEIEATHGYGFYQIGSLWDLDLMEHRKGNLLLSSLEEAFAVPIGWYLAVNTPVASIKGEIIRFVTSSLSLRSLLSSLLSGKTSMTSWNVLTLWRETRGIELAGADVFDFRNIETTAREIRADGSSVARFDPQKYDAVIGDAFQDVRISQERFRLAVYNTTTTTGIGQRVARMLESIGGFVVFVGNAEPPVDGACELSGSKENLKSATSRFIQSIYLCSLQELQEVQRGDLVIHLGTAFEKRYFPY